MVHVNMIEDLQGDLVDIEYFCSAQCFETTTNRPAYGNAWPGGMETDYDVTCFCCGGHMWHGLQCECAS